MNSGWCLVRDRHPVTTTQEGLISGPWTASLRGSVVHPSWGRGAPEESIVTYRLENRSYPFSSVPLFCVQKVLRKTSETGMGRKGEIRSGYGVGTPLVPRTSTWGRGRDGWDPSQTGAKSRRAEVPTETHFPLCWCTGGPDWGPSGDVYGRGQGSPPRRSNLV